MKKLLILSGKGGTGKTTVASAFIKLSDAKAYADCDVDAPNLHLVLDQSVKVKETEYYGLGKASIDPNICVSCGLCKESCRFNAIDFKTDYKVNYYSCEGCGVCEMVCPVGAVKLNPDVAGNLMLYASNTIFSTAQLKMGSGTSGLLVTQVKKQMTSIDVGANIGIIDGSPGIGCPVIASLSGVDMALIVTEPSLSGISDMERIVKTAENFQTKIAICINKYDTNIDKTKEIELYCKKTNIPFVGKIHFDSHAIKAINAGQTIVDIPCVSGKDVREIFNKTLEILLK